MISLYISNLISVLIFLAYGKGINFFLLSKKENTNNIILDILSGAVYISFVALIINSPFKALSIFTTARSSGITNE